MIIALCGFMGAGKSTVGKYLASLLCCEQIDLDAYICKREGRSVPEIFESVGEAGFRAAEGECMREIVERYSSAFSADVSCVLSLGGGAPLNPMCFDLICKSTMCFYLKVPVELLQTRLIKNHAQRPLLAGKSPQELKAYVEEKVAQREDIYRKCSKRVIDTTGKSIEQIAFEIANF